MQSSLTHISFQVGKVVITGLDLRPPANQWSVGEPSQYSHRTHISRKTMLLFTHSQTGVVPPTKGEVGDCSRHCIGSHPVAAKELNHYGCRP